LVGAWAHFFLQDEAAHNKSPPIKARNFKNSIYVWGSFWKYGLWAIATCNNIPNIGKRAKL